MQTATFPQMTIRPDTIRRLTGCRPAWQRRAIRMRLMMAVLVIVLLVAGVVGAVGADTGPAHTVEYRVDAGESLWSIAAVRTAPGEDVRVTVRSLMKLNGLTDSSLSVGQVLVVPAGG